MARIITLGRLGAAVLLAGAGLLAAQPAAAAQSYVGTWRCSANGNIPIGVMKVSGGGYQFQAVSNTLWHPKPKDSGNGSGAYTVVGGKMKPSSGPLKTVYKVVGSFWTTDLIYFHYVDGGGAALECRPAPK